MVGRELRNHYENVSLRVRKTSEIKSAASTILELIDCVKVSLHIAAAEMKNVKWRNMKWRNVKWRNVNCL